MRLRKIVVAGAVVAASIGALAQPASAEQFDGCRSNVSVFFGLESTVPGQSSRFNTNISQCAVSWGAGNNPGRGYGSEVFLIPPGATHMSAAKFTYTAEAGGWGDAPLPGRTWGFAYYGNASGGSGGHVENVTTSATGTVSGRVNFPAAPLLPTAAVTGNLLVHAGSGSNLYSQTVGSATKPYIYCGNTGDIVNETGVDPGCSPFEV